MFNASNSIAVHVLQIPNNQNGKTAIVSASLVIPNGRVVSDVCSVSPRSPFEKEDSLELAKNKVVNSIKQKAEPYIQNHQNISRNAIQDDKNKFKGEETSLLAVINCPSFATRLRSRGKIQRSLLLPALANTYKTSRDAKLIA